MLSRVADSIYWMSRNVERAENLARFIDVTFNLILDLPEGSAEQWGPLIYATGDQDYFHEHYGRPSQDTVIRFLAFDPNYSNSIASCIRLARENARSIREAISSEMWESLNNFYHMVKAASRNPGHQQAPLEFCHEVKTASHLFNGITDGTMSHGEGWHFARLGRMLERADKTSRILDVKYFMILPNQEQGSVDELQWSSVLRSVSGLQMFRKRHHGITPQRVVGFLALDRLFPRAIMHCIDAANDSLHAISGSPVNTFWNAAEKSMGKLRSELAYVQVSEILASGLHEFLDSLQTRMNDVGTAIYDTFIGVRAEGRPV
jgi:uncharacterized alpha-E superfamily protein